MAGPLFWEKKCLEVRFEGAQRGFQSERKGKVMGWNPSMQYDCSTLIYTELEARSSTSPIGRRGSYSCALSIF